MLERLVADSGHILTGHLVHSTYSSAVEGYVDHQQRATATASTATAEAFGWDDVVVLTSIVAAVVAGFSEIPFGND